MTGFARAKEDRPTPPEVYNWRVYAMALVISMGVLTYGYDSSFIGTTITQKSFQRDFGMDKMSKKELNDVSSNLTSIYSAGGFFGALFAFFSLELLGRRWTVILSDIVFIVGALFCTIGTVPSRSLGLIYTGRLLTGLGVGGIAAVSPIYIAEISPPAIRGRLTGFFESFYQTGAVIGFSINYGIVHNLDTNDSNAWRIPMAVQLIPAGILALMAPILKESPTWLLKRGREEEAYQVYSFIRMLPADHEYIAEDVHFIKEGIAKERAALVGSTNATLGRVMKGAARESSLKGMRNRFLLVFLMFMWQAWSGAAAINYYSPTIFTSIGLTDVTLWTGIYGVIKAAGSIIFFTWFIDKFGRKWPWIISSLACAFCQYYLAIYIAIGHPETGVPQSASTVAGGKGATAMIMIFGAAWSFGANGLPWIISAEIFPSSLRSISGPFAAMSVWLWTYVVTRALPSMYTSMGWGVYVFFATCLVCASIYAFFFIHETKGLRVDQMDELFGFEKRHQVGAPAAKAFAEDDDGETTKAKVVKSEVV
ncbi:MFS quinate transporter-like protein QutD [Paraphaeosphaeria sporulosa]|uniref:MFS quinate transporter-like protein QutD n=1 Tax=Paraphaeosphaeria sporulosa TaxID=1460663 RepID=A0A177CKP4_9PLEO|nr:MFS quinate transporter-like protein QutD [Paraphaeosphaeria sporulosa]OAG08073.1 MFS quinate transporter-like protein QutD [Paraphaeosphaeria sporulosa]